MTGNCRLTTVFLGVGSNLGDREYNINQALRLLGNKPGISVEATSPIYETDPVGYEKQGKFLNAVWKISTALSPESLLDALLSIENKLGRERRVRFGSRTIDLDILFYDGLVCNSDKLTIPHPRLAERLFVLRPLADIAPAFAHPVIHKSVMDLLKELECGARLLK